MLTEYTYRTGDLTDINAIKNITWQAYSQFKDQITPENLDEWQKKLNNLPTYFQLLKTGTSFVCEYKNRLVGSAFFVPSGNLYKWFAADWSYIRLVAVHTDYEGRGIGQQLTQMCIDEAIKTGEKIIALHTSQFQHAARHIYGKLGFVQIRALDVMHNQTYYLYLLEL
jgi:GNAT superfamily N-acetyltransferase